MDLDLPPPAMPPPPDVPVVREPRPWWKRWWGISSIVFVSLVFLAALLPESEPGTPSVADARESAGPEERTASKDRYEVRVPATSPLRDAATAPAGEPTASPTAQAAPPPAPTPAPPPPPSPKPPAGALVTRVVDGDTIDVKDGSAQYRVRLAQVDAPELKECYGQQASNWLTQTILAHTVKLERTTNGPDEDRYTRKVREVWLTTTSINVEIVRLGYAEHYEQFASEDPDLAARMVAAEKEAKAANRGLWKDCTAPPPPPPPSSSGHTGKTDGGWSCHPAYQECLPSHLADMNCKDVGHLVHLTGSSDPWRLDGNDNDGLGCESYATWSASKTYPYY